MYSHHPVGLHLTGRSQLHDEPQTSCLHGPFPSRERSHRVPVVLCTVRHLVDLYQAIDLACVLGCSGTLTRWGA